MFDKRSEAEVKDGIFLQSHNALIKICEIPYDKGKQVARRGLIHSEKSIKIGISNN